MSQPLTGASIADTATGLIKFIDVDKSDIHSAVITGVVTSGVTTGLPDSTSLLAWLSKGAMTEQVGTTAGSLVWNFSAPDSAFDYLSAAQTATLTYTVQITDSSGVSISQNVTITVTGTNDAPSFVAIGATLSGAVTETANVTGSTANDTVNGILNFADVDLADTHTLTVTSVMASGVITGLPTNATLKAFLTKGALAEQTDQTPGSVPWTFTASDSTFDYLGAGETATLTYLVTLADNKSGSVTQNVVITVTGTNDAPVIATGTTTGAFTERAGLTGVTTADTATGLVKFTDVDKSDIHSAVITGVAASGVTTGLPDSTSLLAWLSKGAMTEQVGTTAGSLAWSFSAPDSAFDYLSAAQIATLTYTVQITDSSGVLISQNVTITVTGTNDAPSFVATGATLSGTITETANVTGSTANDTVNGLLNFVDADLADTHMLTVTSVTASGIVAGLPANATLKALLTTGALTEQAGQAPGSAAWTFTASDKTFDYLGAGQTTTLTYVVTLADNKAGSITQNVVITVTGANDAPMISGTTTAAGAITERANLTGSALADVAAGAIKFTDPDNGDVHTLTVTGVTASGMTSLLPSAPTLLSWLTLGAVSEPSGATTGSSAWNFSAPDSTFDYLATGETLVLTYTILVADSSGSSVSQNVVLTITGANDKPVAAPHTGLTTDNWTSLAVSAAQLLAGATDPDASDTMAFSGAAGAVGGTVTMINGSAVFTPTATKIGPASFTYTISDGHGGTSVATVGLNVTLHQITGTSGSDTLSGSTKPAQIDGLAGNDVIAAGTLGDFITGGAGNDTLTGGAGIDTFAYHAGFGLDTINSFTATGTKHDVLQFDSNVFSDWAHLLGATAQQGSDLLITLDPTDKITLKNVSLASFSSADAVFV